MKIEQATPLPHGPEEMMDTAGINELAAAMASKLAISRAKGRGGWHSRALCSQQYLSDLLWEHVAKGDPVDVANFAMMLYCRGEVILSPTNLHVPKLESV